ncbi:MAG: Hsp33 family molecular chaperone HslO [Desulfuromonadaceae bacterium]|nr:Hsp33 family molecular chaperone HslO [Desulfuromonadaceae bacterium]MDD5104528.1 Hsp33 family molecular chaperone HslO [Desulfuromonadaceae bacterium]
MKEISITMADQMVRALCLSGGVRILACNAAELARDICTLQQTSATASITLARGLAGGALMGALLKTGQRTALKFEGNGPLRKMIIEADSDGAVRGCVGNPTADLEPVAGKWNVAGLIGKAGFLTVSKDLGSGGQPYQGVVQLVSSEVGEDLAYYLADSEQTPSAVGLAATLAEDGSVIVCGGFLVQTLPKADDGLIENILARIAGIPSLSGLLGEKGAAGVVAELFGDVPYTILETHDIFFRCGCSREKVERALLTLGAEELQDMREKESGAEVTCEFCRTGYQFDARGLDDLITQCAQHSGC